MLRPGGSLPVLCVLVSALLAGPLYAQARTPAPGLEQVVAAALSTNPDLVAARLRIDSAHGERTLARAFPNPGFGISPGLPYQYSLSTSLDLGPQRVFRTRAAGAALLAAKDDVADVTRQVVFGVRQAFYDVLLAEAQRGLATERRDIVRQFLSADSTRLRAGDLAPREITRAVVELSRADADLTRADAQVHVARLALQLLMGSERPDTAFQVSGTLVYRAVDIPEGALPRIAESNRPDLKATRQRMAQSRAAVHLAAADLLPAPGAVLVYQPSAPFSNGSSYAIGFGMTVPLFSWHGGERERARAGLATAVLAERRTQALIANDLQTALDGYRAARALTERFEGGLLAESQAALEMTRYAYRAGAASLLELLDAVRTYVETRSDYAIAVHDYWVNVSALSRASGTDFTQ